MFFSKYSASGNDFIITHIFGMQPHGFDKLAQRICNRHQGVGADGLIILKPHLEYDFEWEFYNCDGSVAQMCGNGSRVAAMYAYHLGIAGVKQRFLTLAGVIDTTIENEEVESALSGVKVLQESICEFGNTWALIDTGVPHLVCEKKGELGKEDLRFLRHKYNANVNIATIEKDRVIARTFERGVEDETLACGTGMAAMFYYLLSANKIPNPCLFNPASKEDLFLREYQQRLYLKGKVHKICDFVY
ncbi:diaminopimelate epimerase [Helicobacter turcicus]|uniref:Diaminopimelate epimerase n=1 Tax=Helicobacter turcicus TaxID=2867412 RepID=A0ABS7JM48_9HELI|nr:diaminopimelate epimerase [Helicobacter turcicus]MBX7490468.1 diaminopimelate epimerase [Helicobacter turcicus]MBX7545328.1 diaminopimelate epimerase [Helicobacter turcicus]